MVDDRPPVDAANGPSRRPQSVMLNFFGIYFRHQDAAVYTGSVIDVMERVGVTEQAVRTTLARMASRGLLVKHRIGRKAYVSLTPRATQVLEDGHRRIWETGALNSTWDGSWTLVGFSIPDARREARHELRQLLTWAGFGFLQNGLWVHPGTVDVEDLIAPLGLEGNVTAMTARSLAPTTPQEMVERAYDLPEIAARYRSFIRLWSRDVDAQGVESDPLARQLHLHDDWLHLVRRDPRLPVELVPRGWPVLTAEHLFRSLATSIRAQAAATVAQLVHVVPLSDEATSHQYSPSS
jgi:phenylacetic acid degradation operon negative regulatory protein